MTSLFSKFSKILLASLFLVGVSFPLTSQAASTCSMTIISDQHVGFENATTGDGECSGLIYGFYAANINQFKVNGFVNKTISYSGEQFTIHPPTGSTEVLVTVYTVLKEKPAPTPAPAPSPAPAPTPAPSQPAPTPAPAPKPSVTETKPSQSAPAVSKTEPTKQTTTNETKSNEQSTVNSESVKEEETLVASTESKNEVQETENQNIDSEKVEKKKIEPKDEKKKVTKTSNDTKEESNSNVIFISVATLVVLSGAIGGYVWFRKKG